MDGATLQAKIYRGYAKAAGQIGLPCAHYRASSALTPLIASGNMLPTLSASFNAEDMEYGKARDYGKAAWYCLADGTQLSAGDYLVRPDGTSFFIASMQPLLPIFAVMCNRVLTLYRPQQQSGIGAAAYGGTTVASNNLLMAGFPASMLQSGGGGTSDVNLPGNVHLGSWTILLPNLPRNVLVRNDDIVTDDLARRYVVASAEQTALGWRITALEAET
jgi:hypothetical protein